MVSLPPDQRSVRVALSCRHGRFGRHFASGMHGRNLHSGIFDTALSFVSRAVPSLTARFHPHIHQGMKVLGAVQARQHHVRHCARIDSKQCGRSHMDESWSGSPRHAAARGASNVVFGPLQRLWPAADASFDAVFARTAGTSQSAGKGSGIPARTATRGRGGCMRPRLGDFSARHQPRKSRRPRAQQKSKPKQGRHPRRSATG